MLVDYLKADSAPKTVEYPPLFGRGWRSILQSFNDEDEQLTNQWRSDQPTIKLGGIDPDPQGQNMVVTALKTKYRILKDLLVYARGRSQAYPYVDLDAFEDLLKKMGITSMPREEIAQIMRDSIA